MDAVAHCADLARRFDRDRFLCALFAPPPARPGLFALLAFNQEVANIPATTTEPLIGLMRLQWWRDVLDGVFTGGAGPLGSPVAEALGAAVHRHGLPRSPFDDVLDARGEALDGMAVADERDLERRAVPDSALAILALRVLGTDAAPADEAARHVGIAWGILGMVRAMPYRAQGGWHPFPATWCREEGLDPAAGLAGDPGACQRLTRRLAGKAAGHLAQARAAHRAVPRAAVPALLPASLADAYLRRLKRNGYDPNDAGLRAAGGGAMLRLGARAYAGRY